MNCLLPSKFRSTLAKIANISKNTSIFIKYHIFSDFGGWGWGGVPSVRPVLPPGPSARSVRPVRPPGPSARSVRPVLPWWVGGRGPFSKSTIFNYFRHNKSEPDLKDNCIFTVFSNFLPNRFCFIPEPHELFWKSVTAILHIILVSIFEVFFKV